MQSLLPVPSVMEVLCAAWSCARIRLLPCSFSPCSCWMYWLCWLSRNKFVAALVFDISKWHERRVCQDNSCSGEKRSFATNVGSIVG